MTKKSYLCWLFLITLQRSDLLGWEVKKSNEVLGQKLITKRVIWFTNLFNKSQKEKENVSGGLGHILINHCT